LNDSSFIDTKAKTSSLEGNRRLTVYKLLTNPALSNNDSLKLTFEQLALKAGITSKHKIDVLVTEDEAESKRLIERKHLKSNNEIGWGDSERAHYNLRKGGSDRQTLIKVAIAKEIKKTGLDESTLDKVLGRGFVTTFQRIMTGSAASEVFGYAFDEDGELLTNDPDFIDKLKVVILNVLQKQSYDGNEINSRSLNSTAQIKNYLSNIGSSEIGAAEVTIIESKQENLLGESVVSLPQSNGKKSVPKSTNRKYLIPKTCVLQIHGQDKINNIYHELRENILLDDSRDASPNAAGVLFRVFLETSLDCFLEKNGRTVKQDDTISFKNTPSS